MIKFQLTPIILEGGNAWSKSGAKANKVRIADFEPEQYEDYKKSLIQLLLTINNAYKEYSGEPIFPKEDLIKSYKIISGSGNQFFKKPREAYIKVKPVMGDLDVQIDKSKKEAIRKFLEEKEGTEFAGWKLLGTLFNQDHCNIFRAPEKFQPVAGNVQVDFEYIQYEDSAPSKFDSYTKTTEWSDLEAGVKGLARPALVSTIYRVKYGKPGVVLQNKKDYPSKQYKSKQVPSINYTQYGTGKKYEPVMGVSGDQLEWGDKPAFREIQDMKYNRNLDKIFEEMFDTEPSVVEQKMMMSYVGMLKLMKKYFDRETIYKIWKSYKFFITGQFDIPEQAKPVIDIFARTFPYVKQMDADAEKAYQERKAAAIARDQAAQEQEQTVGESFSSYRKRVLPVNESMSADEIEEFISNAVDIAAGELEDDFWTYNTYNGAYDIKRTNGPVKEVYEIMRDMYELENVTVYHYVYKNKKRIADDEIFSIHISEFTTEEELAEYIINEIQETKLT